MEKEILIKLKEHRSLIASEVLEENITTEELNSRLLNRQAIIHEYLRTSGRAKEFLNFVSKLGAAELYTTGRQHLKRISRERLVQFGMTDLIQALENQGWEVA